MDSQPIPSAEIATAQQAGCIYAFDRGSKQRELSRRQRAYANLLAKLEAFLFLFEEGSPPELVLRGSSTEVVMGLGDAVHQVEPILRDLLDKVLCQMEADIVALHLIIEREEQEALAHPTSELDYTAAVRQLCGITEELPLASTPAPAPASVPASPPVANARSPRTATTAPGTGLGRAGSTATAAAA